MEKMARIILVALSLCGVAVFAEPGACRDRTISVNGTAVVRVVPDTLVVGLRIESFNADVRKAYAEVGVRTQKVLELTKKLQIDPQDVQTSHISMHTTTHRETGVIQGYTASSRLVITLRDQNYFSEFIAQAVETGQVLVDDLEFQSSHAREKRSEARRMALQAALKKAESLAQELGQRVGHPLMITDQAEGGYRYDPFSNVDVRETGGGTADVVDLAPGEIKIEAGVHVEFELVDGADPKGK